MKRKFSAVLLCIAFILCMSAVSFADDYDPQYPLKGKLEELGLEFTEYVTYSDWDYKTGTGIDPHRTATFKWGRPADDDVWQKCYEENTLKYRYLPTGSYDQMIAIALLAGEPVARTEADEGMYFQFATDTTWQRAYALADNIRAFLNTFENGWQNASEYEKAVHICKWIRLARYNEQEFYKQWQTSLYNPSVPVDEDVYSAYGCLINKDCVCSGYTNAAHLLALVTGIEVENAYTTNVNHVWPVFRINGVWLDYDPSANGENLNSAMRDMRFTVYDVYYLQNLTDQNHAKWVEETGREAELNKYTLNGFFNYQDYTVPTDLREYFPSEWCNQIAGAKYGDGNHSIYGVLEMHDECGHFPYNQVYTE